MWPSEVQKMKKRTKKNKRGTARLTGEHGEEPGNGVKVGHEADRIEVVAQHRVVEGDQVREFGQIFLDHRRVVLPEEAVQVLGHKGRKAGVRQGCTK